MTTVDDSVSMAPTRRVVVAEPRPARGRPRTIARQRQEESIPSPVLPRRLTEEPHRAAIAAAEGPSPTVDVRHVMTVFAVGILLASILGIKGLVHSGKGMDLGPERTVVLALGEPLQAVASALGLTLPWDATERALGRETDLESAPLLASGPTSSKPVHRHPNAALPPLPYPSSRHPLRLLITGDSLTEYLGPQLADEATRLGPVMAQSDTHYGTGIVRPDFVDWSVVARQQLSRYHPQAVVVFMGGNDDQNMTMPNGAIIQAGSAQWTKEYSRRVAICMRIWSQGGRARVYWLSMPPARSDSWSAVNRQINIALRRAAAQVPRARYLDVLGPVTEGGRYADFVNVNGQPTLVRTPDGIHFNSTGSDIVSHEVVQVLKSDWRLGRAAGQKQARVSAHPTITTSER